MSCRNGSRDVRELLSTFGSRGDVEPMVGGRGLVGRGRADLALIDDRDGCFAVGEIDRATAVAGTIRTDGPTVAATLMPDAVDREGPPASAHR
jgi:hypothetical protein